MTNESTININTANKNVDTDPKLCLILIWSEPLLWGSECKLFFHVRILNWPSLHYSSCHLTGLPSPRRTICRLRTAPTPATRTRRARRKGRRKLVRNEAGTRSRRQMLRPKLRIFSRPASSTARILTLTTWQQTLTGVSRVSGWTWTRPTTRCPRPW